jgi:hypothetical protein
MGILDENDALMLQKLWEIHEKNNLSLEEYHSRLCGEFITLKNVIS